MINGKKKKRRNSGAQQAQSSIGSTSPSTKPKNKVRKKKKKIGKKVIVDETRFLLEPDREKKLMDVVIDREIAKGNLDANAKQETYRKKRKRLAEMLTIGLDPDDWNAKYGVNKGRIIKSHQRIFSERLITKYLSEITEDQLHQENKDIMNALGQELAKGNLVMINDKHNNAEPFLYASKLMKDYTLLNGPGTLMIEGPVNFDEWEEEAKNRGKPFDQRLEEWGENAWQDFNGTGQVAAVKEARRLGWNVVSVDKLLEDDPGNDAVTKGDKKRRQEQIGTKVKEVMDQSPDRGKILIIGTSHITGATGFTGSIAHWTGRNLSKGDWSTLQNTARARFWVLNEDSSVKRQKDVTLDATPPSDISQLSIPEDNSGKGGKDDALDGNEPDHGSSQNPSSDVLDFEAFLRMNEKRESDDGKRGLASIKRMALKLGDESPVIFNSANKQDFVDALNYIAKNPDVVKSIKQDELDHLFDYGGQIMGDGYAAYVKKTLTENGYLDH